MTKDGLVTVIVACSGQLEYTRLCVPSLVRFSRYPVELIFLDSESLDGTGEYLEGLAAGAAVKVEVVRVSADPPPPGARKDEIVPIRGDYVALLNNDVIVTQGWLESLVKLADSIPEIGMTAPMSNGGPGSLRVDPEPYGVEELGSHPEGSRSHPEGSQTRLRALIDRVNAFAQKWRESNREHWFEADILGGGCVLLKREVLQRLGVFPTRTPLGTFDTESLSQRARLAGCQEAFVHDFGSRGANHR